MAMQTTQRPTLGVAKVTPRVTQNRAHHNPAFTFGKFRKGLIRSFGFDIRALSSYPKGFWKDQYDTYLHRDAVRTGRLCVQGLDAHTVEAFEWMAKSYGEAK